MENKNNNAQIIEQLEAIQPVTWESVQKLAEETGYKAKSLVQICVRNDITYNKKQRVSKTGGVVMKKDMLVMEIASLLGITSDDLDGLTKASKTSLVALRKAVS